MSLTYGCKVPRLTRPGFERKRLLTPTDSNKVIRAANSSSAASLD